ncbi:MAG: hypothetical protein CVU65_09200 [Deltaproteobacteria bacterium HGW-Deltaproteobacteria-22]|nr:MAG: hypothetical protein CVU65_09200 [Deltaproteobacteria bacterium HGW-Deltaproteobacteria-22]
MVPSFSSAAPATTINPPAPPGPPSDQLRYDACITVDRPVTPEGEVGFRILAGGRTAVFLHQGPYAELHRTYESIYGSWLPTSGEELADAPCYEIYLNTPDNTAPADLRTEICIPLKVHRI